MQWRAIGVVYGPADRATCEVSKSVLIPPMTTRKKTTRADRIDEAAADLDVLLISLTPMPPSLIPSPAPQHSTQQFASMFR